MARSLLVPLLLLVLLPACHGRRATHHDCQVVADRIIELEMKRRGVRDTVAIDIKKRELRADLGGLISKCEGRSLDVRTMDCVKRSTSAEALLRDCL